MTFKKPRQHSPWAEEGVLSYREASQPRQIRPKVICMEGLYVFDPTQVTREDIRQFLWVGLRELRVQARARGWEEEEVRQLLSRTFDVFHDESESIWVALKAVTSSPKVGERGVVATPEEATPESLGGEEDIPIPLTMEFNKPLTLLDPDAEVLASFEE